MHLIKNVYFDEVYKLYFEHFAKFCILVEINTNNHVFYGFLWVQHETRLVGDFHYYIRNQPIKIVKYGEFDGNRKVQLFITAPFFGFGSLFFFNFIFLDK